MGWTHVHSTFKVKLPPQEKLILLALAEHANKENKCWPGRRVLAEKTGLFPTTVSKVLRRLKDKDLISCRRSGSGGQVYTLHLADCNGVGLQSDVPNEHKDEGKEQGAMCSDDTFNVPKEHVNCAQTAPHGALLAPPYKGSIESTIKGQGKDNENLLFCANPAQKKKIPDPNPKPNPTGGEDVTKVNDVLQPAKSAQVEKYVPAQTSSPKIADLERLWIRVHAEVFPNKFTPELTGKERGQLGQFLKKATPKYAELALYAVVREWIEFKEYAVNVHGALNCKGHYPVLAYVAKHAGIAVTYILKYVVKDSTIDEKGLAYVGKKFVEFYDGKDHKKCGKG